MGYLGELSQVAAGGRPLAVAAEVGREGGEGGAVREAARAVFESVGEGAAFFDAASLKAPWPLRFWSLCRVVSRAVAARRARLPYAATGRSGMPSGTGLGST